MFARAAEYLKPMRNFAKLCGTLPGKDLHDSTVSLAYTVYTFLMLAVSAYSYQKAVVSHFPLFKDIVCFTVLLTDVSTFLCHAVTIYIPFSMQQVYFRLWKKFEHVEKIMRSQNIAQNQGLIVFQQYTFIMLSVLSIVLFSFETYVSIGDAVYTLGLVATHTTFLACTLHIISLASVVKNKFKLLNWHLDYLNNKVPFYLLPEEVKVLIENKTQGEHVRVKFLDYSANVRQTTVNKIRAFNQIHFLLYSSCNVINKYFSFQIFGCVIHTALSTICTCIELFDFDSIDSPLDIGFLVVNCYEFIQIFLIANLYHDLSSESKWTAQLVCYLLDEDGLAEDVATELQIFSKELFARKITFSAFGFFDVNLKMITSMVGLTLPVTLFLVQYNNKQQVSSKI